MTHLQKGIDYYTGQPIWAVLDNQERLVDAIQCYVNHLNALDYSPNTIEGYARYLATFWDWLTTRGLNWQDINVKDLSEHVHWLRFGTSTEATVGSTTAIRSWGTIGVALTAIYTFYKFHYYLGNIDITKNLFQVSDSSKAKYKGFLAGIVKQKPCLEPVIKHKVEKIFPGCLTQKEVADLIDACSSKRDKLILLILYETGIRKGELLGLRHEDIGTEGESFIRIVRRKNSNNARVKAGERTIYVEEKVIKLYLEYLIDEYPNVSSDYIFVNIWGGEVGAPLNCKFINRLLKRLEKKIGISAYPHLFRHTHATELLRQPENNLIHVKYRMGHKHIQTTINIYGHLSDQDLQQVSDRSTSRNM